MTTVTNVAALVILQSLMMSMNAAADATVRGLFREVVC